VSAFAAVGPAPRLGNDLTMAAAEAHPGRIYGYVGVNPNFPEDVRPELERCLAHPAMRGIKLHAGTHAYPVEGEGYRPAFEIAHERGLCVLIHGGTASVLRALAERYPGANILSAHVGGWDGRSPSDIVEACRTCPNLYADLASSVAPFGALEALVERVGADKVVFGSDTPLLDQRFALGRVLFSALDEHVKGQVLGANAARLLGLAEA
jgi:predicted TIM-barrel fold metal-dependent hydrolase